MQIISNNMFLIRKIKPNWLNLERNVFIWLLLITDNMPIAQPRISIARQIKRKLKQMTGRKLVILLCQRPNLNSLQDHSWQKD